jgi:hypothetical protein
MNEADCIVANGGIASHSAGHGCTALLSVVTIEARTTSKAIKHYSKLTRNITPVSWQTPDSQINSRITTTTTTNHPQHLLSLQFQQTTEIVNIIPSKWMQSPELSSRHPSQILRHNFPQPRRPPLHHSLLSSR